MRKLPYTTGQMRLVGTLSDNATFSFRQSGVNNGDTTPLIEEFEFTGTNFAYIWRATSTVSTWQIYINGLPIAATPFLPTGITVSAGTLYRLAFTFASASTYRIRIESEYQQRNGIEYIQGDAIVPSAPTKPTWLCYGDSFVQGANGSTALTAWPYLLAPLLGVEMINCGQGGTGYQYTAGVGSRVPYSTLARVQAAAAAKPDVAIIFGSVNDLQQAATDITPIGAAATQTYAYWQQYAPATKLIVIGIQRFLSTQTVYGANAAALVKTKALAAPNVLGYIDPTSGTWQAKNGATGGNSIPWFPVSNGYASNQQNDDPSMTLSSDNVHPSTAGHMHMARRAFTTITDMLAAS